MRPLVLRERRLFPERLAAHVALERPIAGMTLQMPHDLLPLRKLLPRLSRPGADLRYILFLVFLAKAAEPRLRALVAAVPEASVVGLAAADVRFAEVGREIGGSGKGETAALPMADVRVRRVGGA